MLGFVVMASVGSAAAAAPPSAAPSSYTEAIVIADALSVGLLASFFVLPDDPDTASRLGQLGAVGVMIASPLIHLIQGHPKRTAVSLGMRLGSAVAGAACGVWAGQQCNGEGCVKEWGYAGVVIGVGVASILDATLFSWGDALATRQSVWVTPTVTPTSAGLGFVGTW